MHSGLITEVHFPHFGQKQSRFKVLAKDIQLLTVAHPSKQVEMDHHNWTTINQIWLLFGWWIIHKMAETLTHDTVW